MSRTNSHEAVPPRSDLWLWLLEGGGMASVPKDERELAKDIAYRVNVMHPDMERVIAQALAPVFERLRDLEGALAVAQLCIDALSDERDTLRNQAKGS